MAKRGPVTDIGLLPRHSGEQPASSRPEHVASLDPRTATDRSLAIIDIVLSSEAPLHAKMIGAELELPKATVHRLIASLEAKGLIVKDPVSGGYVAGPSLCDMAFKILRKSAASGTRHAILADLAAKVGETCNLGILDGGEARYVDRVEASHSPLEARFPPRIARAALLFGDGQGLSIADARERPCALSLGRRARDFYQNVRSSVKTRSAMRSR